MQGIVNVTARSLALHAGVNVDHPQYPGVQTDSQGGLLKTQLGILQTKPRQEQLEIHCEVAARYLPQLVHVFRHSTGALNPPMTLLNVISYTPYFIRYLKLSDGFDMTALQASRTAMDATLGIFSSNDVAEVGQFLATLLLLQGAAYVSPDDINILIPKFREWKRTFAGTLASDVSERCLSVLQYTQGSIPPAMMPVKSMMESALIQCNGPGCNLKQRPAGGPLLQCTNCKSVVYCGRDHQKLDWPAHQKICFTPSF